LGAHEITDTHAVGKVLPFAQQIILESGAHLSLKVILFSAITIDGPNKIPYGTSGKYESVA